MTSILSSHLYHTEERAMNEATLSGGQIEIQTLERIQRADLINRGPAERIKGFEFIWVKAGSGTLTVDMKDTAISENSVYCLAPGQYRKLQTEVAIKGYYLSLSPEFVHLAESQIDFSLLIEQYRGDCSLLAVRADGEIEESIVRIHREHGSQNFMRRELLKGWVKVFLLYMSRRIEDVYSVNGEFQNEADFGFVRKFMQLLKKDFATKKLVADYADELCITPNYLNYLVKKQTGYPASHHIQQYIIMEAKRRAAYSGLRMKEIAEALGFEDYAHFSKFFKNYSGTNFSSFKKGMLSNNL